MRLLTVFAATLALAAAVAAGATAGTSTVSIVGCALVHGGQATVPAGDTVVFQISWIARNNALAGQFLDAATTTASIDGQPVANAGSYWSSPSGGATHWVYPTGVTLQQGQSLTLTYDVTLAHAVADGFKSQGGGVAPAGSIFGGPVTCTVTAV